MKLPAWYPAPEDGSPCPDCGHPVSTHSEGIGYVRYIATSCHGCNEISVVMVELVPSGT